MTTQSQALRLADSIAKAPFAFPGGYRRHALTDDGATLCATCCKSEREQIATTYQGDGWTVVAEFVHWEGEPINCDHCNTEYPSEYGGEEVDNMLYQGGKE